MSEAEPPASKLGGCLIVEIQRWDRWQHLGPKPRLMPRKYSFQGGLTYSPSFDVWGRLVHPVAMQGQHIRIWISPARRHLKIGPGALRDLGQLHFKEPPSRGWDISVTMLIPSLAAAPATTCLSSVWKYLQLSTFDEDEDGASISAFAFSATQPSESRAP